MPLLKLVSLKNEVTTIDIPIGVTMYTGKDVKRFLHETLKTDSNEVEYKLIHKGSIIQDSTNVADGNYYSDKIVYTKSTKKLNIPKEPLVLNPIITPAPARPVGLPTNVSTIVSQTTDQTPQITPQRVAKSIFNQAVAILLSSPQNLSTFLMMDPTLRQSIQTNPQLVNTIMSMQFITEVYAEITRFCGEIPRLQANVQAQFTSAIRNTNSTSEQNNNTEEVEEPQPVQTIKEENNQLNDWINSLSENEQKELSDFNQQQKTDIMNLCHMGYYFFDVVQLYPACNNDVNLTVEQLANMK